MNDRNGSTLVMSPTMVNGFGHDTCLLNGVSRKFSNGCLLTATAIADAEPEIFGSSDLENTTADTFPRKRRKPKTEEPELEIHHQLDSKTSNGHLKNGKIDLPGLADQNENEYKYVESKETEDEDLAAHDEFGLGISGCCEARRRLLRIHDMPDHLRFNKYVHSGYRSVQNAWGCFMSLFYLHNETVNIFTHVLPIIGVMYYWRSMYPWDEIQGNLFFNVLGWSHVMGSISPWVGSVIYHLFMNHHHGAKFYQFLLQVDMLGIWVTQCFGALTNLTASTWCLPQYIQTGWMVIYAIASVWGLNMALTAWTPLGRRMCFAPVFISRIFGFILRLSPWGGGEPAILAHVILQDVISVVGGMIGVVRIPERWFPGRLDNFCNSHHIMHVLVVCAVLHMNWASNGDIGWVLKNYSKDQCPSIL